MTIENDFLTFATGGSANVLDQADYAALAAIINGYSAGVANSAQMNKTWRQSSIMAAVLAQFIVAQTGQAAIDDGTTATLLSNLTLGVQKAATGRLINVQAFGSSSTYTPTTGANKIHVRVWGGGGGGGAVGAASSSQTAVASGGNAGSYVEFWILNLSNFVNAAITIGAGGAGGAAGFNNGTSGGNTSFVGNVSSGSSPTVTATGGTGGSAGGAGAPPLVTVAGTTNANNTATNISVLVGNSPGVLGSPGVAGSLTYVQGGNGGAGYAQFGGHGAGGGAGSSGGGYGGGGGGAGVGASGGAAGGGAGVSGYVIVEEFA